MKSFWFLLAGVGMVLLAVSLAVHRKPPVFPNTQLNSTSTVQPTRDEEVIVYTPRLVEFHDNFDHGWQKNLQSYLYTHPLYEVRTWVAFEGARGTTSVTVWFDSVSTKSPK